MIRMQKRNNFVISLSNNNKLIFFPHLTPWQFLKISSEIISRGVCSVAVAFTIFNGGKRCEMWKMHLFLHAVVFISYPIYLGKIWPVRSCEPIETKKAGLLPSCVLLQLSSFLGEKTPTCQPYILSIIILSDWIWVGQTEMG